MGHYRDIARRSAGNPISSQPRFALGSQQRARGSLMRRREFIAGLGSTAAAWPLAARAQQGDRVRRIGGLMWLAGNHPGAKSDLSAFTQALAGMGWTEGRNVRMDLRWDGDETNRIPALA